MNLVKFLILIKFLMLMLVFWGLAYLCTLTPKYSSTNGQFTIYSAVGFLTLLFTAGFRYDWQDAREETAKKDKPRSGGYADTVQRGAVPSAQISGTGTVSPKIVNAPAKPPPVDTSLEEALTIAKFQRIVEAYMYLFPKMPTPTIRFVFRDEWPDKSGCNGFAYGGECIGIFPDFWSGECKQDFEGPSLHRFIKHELVHCWIYFKKIKDDDSHGRHFQHWDYKTRGALPKYKRTHPFGIM